MPKYLVVYKKHLELLDSDYITIKFFDDIVNMLDYEDSQPKQILKEAIVWRYSKADERYEKLYDKEWYYN